MFCNSLAQLSSWITLDFSFGPSAPFRFIHKVWKEKPEFFHSPIFGASPDLGWSGTQSSPLWPASADAWLAGWKCWPTLPACTGADTAVCCDASPSGRCPGTSAGWNPRLAPAQGESRRHGQSPCSHHQTWKKAGGYIDSSLDNTTTREHRPHSFI